MAVLIGFFSVAMASNFYLWAFGALLAYGSLLLGAVFLLPKESRADARGFLLCGGVYLIVGYLFFALT